MTEQPVEPAEIAEPVSTAVVGEPAQSFPYDPIEAARHVALTHGVEMTRDLPYADADARIDATLAAADRLFAWMTQPTPDKAG